MNDLFEKSIHTLELPRVLALLANQTVTDEGKERCAARIFRREAGGGCAPAGRPGRQPEYP